jgi:hypothetical protein
MGFGEEEMFAAGFVLNKLYSLRLFARRGNITHGKHTELANMSKSYPPDRRGEVSSVCKKMNGKLILIFKSTRDDHICALLEDDALTVGLELCNRYRKKVWLPPLDRYFKELTAERPKDSGAAEYRRLTDKEKRNKEYLRRTKKMAEGQGLD